MRDGFVIEQRLALGVTPGSEAQVSVFVFHEDVPAFGASELQGGIEQGHEDFIEHSDGVELARGFQKQRELFEVRGLGGNVNARDLAKKFSGGVGGLQMEGVEDHV